MTIKELKKELTLFEEDDEIEVQMWKKESLFIGTDGDVHEDTIDHLEVKGKLEMIGMTLAPARAIFFARVGDEK